MNGILSIAVDVTLGHGMHEKSVQQLVLKICINEQNFGLHIINEYLIFVTLRITTGMKIIIGSSYGFPFKVVMSHLKRNRLGLSGS